MRKKTTTVWTRNVITGIPLAHEAVEVNGPYVRYADGSRSWYLHFLTRKAAFDSARAHIMERLTEDAKFAARHSELAKLVQQ